MAGVIVSGNVAGGVAGGNIIPEPIWPSYATYPDIAEKDDQSLRSIFLDNLNKLLGRVIDRAEPGDPAKKSAPPSTAGLSSSIVPIVLLVAAVVVVVKLLR